MTHCEIAPVLTTKACSGKCKNGGCTGAPRVWVVAACEGMVSLFEKTADGNISPKPQGKQVVFSSLGHFQQSINNAEQTKAFDQLVIVGGAGDIAWLHSLLSQDAASYIAAEIKYPLLANWFKEPFPMPHLTKALQSVFAA